MQTYKVFGDKVINYYVEIDAIDPDDAYDIASGLDSSNWLESEDNNDEITPHTVELQDDLDNN